MEAVVVTPVDRHARVLKFGHQVLAWVGGRAPTVPLGWSTAAQCLAAALERFTHETPVDAQRRCANGACGKLVPNLLWLEAECAVWPLQVDGRAEWSAAEYLRERVAPAVGGFCCCACWRVTDPDTLPPHEHRFF